MMKAKLRTTTLALLALGISLPAMAEDAVLSELTAFPQRTTVMDRYAGGRLKAIWNPQIQNTEKDWWMRSLKDWHSYGDGDAKGRSNSVALGIDKKTGEETRTGFFGMYNYRKLDGGADHALQQDWRVGFYTGKQHGAARKYVYADYGRLGTHVSGPADGKYKGTIVEVGGEYQYDMSRGERGFHWAPYVNAQISRYWQDSGSGSFSSDGLHNTYGAGEAGVEIRRSFEKSTCEMRVGYKRVLFGDSPSWTYSRNGISSKAESHMDKDYLHVTLGGTTQIKGNVSLNCEGGWLEGAHDRELMADLKLNWTF